MDNLTQQELIDEINLERRESNSAFISPANTLKLLNRCNRRIIREPGVRTVPETTTINFTGTGSYDVPDDFKAPKNLVAGAPGSVDSLEFTYVPPDEYDITVLGYKYTFKAKGKIEIMAPDTNALPTTSLTLNYWSKNIVLDEDGITKKAKWENDGDTSRLSAEYDDMYIDFSTAMILRREGKKEWVDRLSLFGEALENLKSEGGVPKPSRPKRGFGHYIYGP